jgi:AcrR family transcriptional regulator
MASVSKARRSPASIARRQRIVEAAVRLFANAPYASVHMDAVATAAAMVKPTIYRYFPSKESLFVASLEWALEDLRTALQNARLEPAPGELKLHRLIAMVLDRIEHLAPAIHAIESQDPQWGKESRRILRQGFRSLRAEISALIRDGQRDDQFADVDPDLASLVILGGIRMAAHSRPGQGKALADSMARILLGGLRGANNPDRPCPSPSTLAGAIA